MVASVRTSPMLRLVAPFYLKYIGVGDRSSPGARWLRFSLKSRQRLGMTLRSRGTRPGNAHPFLLAVPFSQRPPRGQRPPPATGRASHNFMERRFTGGIRLMAAPPDFRISADLLKPFPSPSARPQTDRWYPQSSKYAANQCSQRGRRPRRAIRPKSGRLPIRRVQ